MTTLPATDILSLVMSKYINPMNDFFMRYLLGSKGSENDCRGFVNAVLKDFDFPAVSSLVILNPFNLKDYHGYKESVIDCRAQSDDGRVFNIEIQTSQLRDFDKKTLFYWAKAYTSPLEEGHGYGELSPVISINLLDFVLWPELEQVHSCFMLKELRNPDCVFSKDIIVHCLEAPKLEDHLQGLGARLRGWLAYLKSEGKVPETELWEIIKEDPVLQEAHKRYNKFLSDPELMEAYEGRQKWLHDQATIRDEGFEDGIMQTVKGFKAAGADMELIIKATGLSKEEIQKL